MNPRPKIVDRILEAVRQARTFCVVGHIRPDGDCVGSQIAMTMALREQGKDVVCWNEDRCPPKLAFLDPDGLLRTPTRGQRFDCVVALDSASYERLGVVGQHIQHRGMLLNIDHHSSNTRFGEVNWISPRSPSSGELVYRLLKSANWPVTPRIATCLFTAVSTDTGSFQYPTTRPATFVTAGELVKRGADVARVCQEVYQSFPLSRVRLLQHVYNRFQLAHRDQIAWFWLRGSDFTRTKAHKSDVEGLIDHIRAIEPVIVACVFEELGPDETRVSLRSKSNLVNVAKIAQVFGGGGHAAAAGAKITGQPATIERRVLQTIRKALNSHAGAAGAAPVGEAPGAGTADPSARG